MDRPQSALRALSRLESVSARVILRSAVEATDKLMSFALNTTALRIVPPSVEVPKDSVTWGQQRQHGTQQQQQCRIDEVP